MEPGSQMNEPYPVEFSVDYPDRDLNRLTTAFRILWAIPILIVAATISGSAGFQTWAFAVGSGGVLFLPAVLMIVFRQKYPRWWYDWNLELMRFSSRIGAYVALMDDRYPSTDEEQSVHLDFPYPDARQMSRWLPLVKWFLAVPHYFVLLFLGLGALGAVVLAWFAILFTGTYPRSLFDYVVGVIRWINRVNGYAFTLITDQYPPFSLR